MQIQIQTNVNANRVDKYRSIYWRKKLCSFPEEKTQQPGSKIRNSELKKRKNQFSSCTKVGISFDDDGKTGAISNKQFKASHKNAWNEEEKESAHKGLHPKRALTKMNKHYVIPHSFSLQHTSMSPKTWEVLWVCNNAWWL